VDRVCSNSVAQSARISASETARPRPRAYSASFRFPNLPPCGGRAGRRRTGAGRPARYRPRPPSAPAWRVARYRRPHPQRTGDRRFAWQIPQQFEVWTSSAGCRLRSAECALNRRSPLSPSSIASISSLAILSPLVRTRTTRGSPNRETASSASNKRAGSFRIVSSSSKVTSACAPLPAHAEISSWPLSLARPSSSPKASTAQTSGSGLRAKEAAFLPWSKHQFCVESCSRRSSTMRPARTRITRSLALVWAEMSP
jgi:hypothetical protein